MNHYSGLLDGHTFTAGKPFVVMAWPSKSAVTAFDSKLAAWNFLEAASRHDPTAVFARVYEFTSGRWERIPSLPTYLTKLEVNREEAEMAD
jgi:hypothetical protein